jgi:predicted ATP-grasp superfamily ATP-dependent carboligase
LKLAIVGASARAAAFSALRAGYDVFAADMFADADLQRAANVARIDDYPFGLIEWLERSDCDAWLYTGALENYPVEVARMAALRPLLGNDGESLRRVRDPLELQRAAMSAGLSFPETRMSAAGLPQDGSWLCKTYRGASGSGVWALDGEASLQRAGRERAVFQKHVDGVSAAAVFACGNQQATLLGMTQQLVGELGASPWQYAGSLGPIECSLAIHAQLAAIGDVLANQFHLRGLAGVDLMIADDRVWIIEVNPRYTASVEVLERATGVSAIAAHVAACESATDMARGAIKTPLNKSERFHGKLILFAPHDACVSQTFFNWAMEQTDRDGGALADIPHPGEEIPAGRPVLTLFAAATAAADCRAALSRRLDEVQSRLDA